MCLAMFSWAIAWTNAKIVNEYLSFYNLIFLRFFIGFISIYPLIAKKDNLKVLTSYNLKFIMYRSYIKTIKMKKLFCIVMATALLLQTNAFSGLDLPLSLGA